jgi:hypothetical protein
VIRGSCLCGGVRFEIRRGGRSAWFEIADELPQLDRKALVALRSRRAPER